MGLSFSITPVGCSVSTLLLGSAPDCFRCLSSSTVFVPLWDSMSHRWSSCTSQQHWSQLLLWLPWLPHDGDSVSGVSLVCSDSPPHVSSCLECCVKTSADECLCDLLWNAVSKPQLMSASVISFGMLCQNLS